MRDYWTAVWKRAAREALRDAKIDTPVAAATGFLAQAVIGTGLFFALGHFTTADLWVRAMSALAPFAVFPIAFVIRTFTVPAEMAKEQASKLAAAKTAEDHKQARLKLASLLGEVQELMDRVKRDHSDAPHEANDLCARIVAHLRAEFDETYVARFMSGEGLSVHTGGMDGFQLRAYAGLYTAAIRLREFIGEPYRPA